MDETHSILPPHDEHASVRSFAYLITGLHSYLTRRDTIPANFRRALNEIALQQRAAFPKTLDAFIRECHHSVRDWYPLKVPVQFDPSQPILVENMLSEEAQLFCLEISELLDLRNFSAQLPQMAFDNLAMVDLRNRLRQQGDVAAQSLYVDVRSFLIEHSCFTRQTFCRLHLEAQREVKHFAEELLLPANELPICDQCGLLDWRDNDWHGIKPDYCSEHGENAASVRWIVNEGGMYRLKRGIHLRTFLPGRAELRLFTFAETLRDQFPDQLLKVERYPGIDTYDLRLTFADTIWAVDVKDHASAHSFVKQVRPLFNEGDLRHNRAFYVIPDVRLDDSSYARVVQQKRQQLPRNLDIQSESVFQQAVQRHIEALTQPRRKSRRKEA
jgi:hypothetical protein